MHKATQVRSTFGSWAVQTTHALWRCTFRSRNVKTTPRSGTCVAGLNRIWKDAFRVAGAVQETSPSDMFETSNGYPWGNSKVSHEKWPILFDDLPINTFKHVRFSSCPQTITNRQRVKLPHAIPILPPFLLVKLKGTQRRSNNFGRWRNFWRNCFMRLNFCLRFDIQT